MRKLSVWLFLGLFTLVTMGGAAFAKGFQDLSFNGGYLPLHPVTKDVFQPFFKAAAEKFPGKNGLSFHSFAVGELYPEPEAMTALTDGRVDFGMVAPAQFPGKMSLTGAAAIPGILPNSTVGSLVFEELIEEFPEVRAQFPENSTSFTSWMSPATHIHTLMPVKNLDELKGKKLIVWNAKTGEIAKALGANPIRITNRDTYIALSKGMADGVICPLAPLRSLKATESAKHHLMIPLGVERFVMNAHTPLWNEMPEDMRAWLKEEGSKKLPLAIGKSLDGSSARDEKLLKEEGHEFYYPSPEDQAKLAEILKTTFEDQWKKDASKDVDPAMVEKILNFVKERGQYHTEQQKAGAYDKPVSF